MNRITLAGLLVTIATTAFAAGAHKGGHHDLVVGEPGKAANVTKTIKVEMSETDDGKMLFSPNAVTVAKGDTIRFALVNTGEGDHEFVLDEHAKIMEHKEIMEKFPEMEHDDPNAIRLEPGKSGDIIWKFTNGGEFHFACLMPGHYESGMHGKINVTTN